MTSTTPPAEPFALTVVHRVDQPDPAAITATAWARTVGTITELALLCNPLEVERIDVADRLPHLPERTAVEHFSTYAEVAQQLAALVEDSDREDPAVAARIGELQTTARALLAALLEGHPYAPGWTAGTAANAVKLAELANRYREDARDARRQRDRDVREADTARRTAELHAAELAQVVDDLTAAPVPYVVDDGGPVAGVVHLGSHRRLSSAVTR